MSDVRIVEVGPRDGLQNESTTVGLDVKLRFIRGLADSGLKEIEATSFVSPNRVPQLADADGLWPLLPHHVPGGPLYSALVPNARGLTRALALSVDRISVFAATSESFSRANLNMSVAESLSVFEAVIAEFTKECPRGHVRGYVSTAFECPYEGKIAPERTLQLVQRLFEIGVSEVSIGDTTGVAGPTEVARLARLVRENFGENAMGNIAWHFHDTNGTAAANVYAALELGFRSFDSSAAGLGGCPFAPGAGGNYATEDLVYLLERSGLATGVDLGLLSVASLELLNVLGRAPTAKAQVAQLARASVA